MPTYNILFSHLARQLLMAAGLSQLSRVALGVPPPATALKPLAKTATAVAEEAIASLMPPPAGARHSFCGALSGLFNATPKQAENVRRQIVTPLTNIVPLVTAAAATPASTVFQASRSAAVSAPMTVLSTPGSSATNHLVTPTCAAAAQPTVGASDADKMPADAAATTALLAASPGTALAADILASAIGWASGDNPDRPRRADAVATRDDAAVEKEQLYSRFAAAATPGTANSSKCGEAPIIAKSTGATKASSGSVKRKLKCSPKNDGAVQAGAEKNNSKSSLKGGVDARAGIASAPPTGSQSVTTLHSILLPPAKKRKARRWLTSDQKTFVCGIGGCERAYGSASSLCAHKRAHHPGWKEERKRQRDIEAEAAAADAAAAAAAGGEEEGDRDEEKEEEDEDDDNADVDVAGRAARREGAAALDAETRATPSGAWVEALAADTHGRLGALRRSRQRVQRGLRDARAASAKHPPPVAGTTDALGSAKYATAAAESVAAAAAARLLQQMESALEAESERLQGWLGRLESIAELRMRTGKVLAVSQGQLEGMAGAHLQAAQVAEQTAKAIAAVAAVAQANSINGKYLRKDSTAAVAAKNAAMSAKHDLCEKDEEKEEVDEDVSDGAIGPQIEEVMNAEDQELPHGEASLSTLQSSSVKARRQADSVDGKTKT